MKTILILLSIFSGLLLKSQAQDEYTHLKKGNELYDKGAYQEAEKEYTLASEWNHGSFEAAFNLGNALYRQDSLEKAADQFQLAANLARDPKQEAMAWHNLGNTYLSQRNYQKSIDAYKKALRKNPQDDDTRYNFVYAKKMLENEQKNQQSDKNDQNQNKDKQDKDNQNKEDKSAKDDDQQKQDDKNKGNKDKEREQKQDKGQGDQKEERDPGEEQNQPQPRKGELSAEDAARLLDALEQNEEQLRKNIRLKEEKADPKHIEKNW